MKFAIGGLTALLLCSFGAAKSGENSPKLLDRCNLLAVGENSSRPSPYSVSIQIKLPTGECTHMCTGTIIAEDAVITTSDCVQMADQFWKYVQVVAGISEEAKNQQQIRSVEKIVIHPGSFPFYIDSKFNAAVIFVEEPFIYNNYIYYASLTSATSPGVYAKRDSVACKYSGWEVLEDDVSDNFMFSFFHTAAEFIGDKDCLEGFKDLDPAERNYIRECLKNPNPDSTKNYAHGGPLVCMDNVLTGIATNPQSVTSDGKLVGFPEFTEIRRLAPWLSRVVPGAMLLSAF